MSIRDWPKAERPRERLIEQGPNALSDGELLAVLIGCGRRGRSAVDLARSLIDKFGSLREFLSAEPSRCLGELGIGPARYASMQAALELARRHYREPLRSGCSFKHPEAVRAFLLAQLRDRPHEVFCCLHLDQRHRLIAFEELFNGSLDTSSVHIREIVRRLLRHNAAALICAHNHPSGVAEPSEADFYLTRRLKDTLASIDVRLVDHVIVGDTRCFSFADRGLV
ncbi:MAG TPA: DNA repair protein RadC [Steroidobacteraceae bacterium]|jgi:DNA repair protein RadC|nr:DNA repair protein RadC [Steroidobacteraceae bacterium]